MDTRSVQTVGRDCNLGKALFVEQPGVRADSTVNLNSSVMKGQGVCHYNKGKVTEGAFYCVDTMDLCRL